MSKLAAILVAVLAVMAISAGTTYGMLAAFPELLPQGKQGQRGPAGPRGPEGPGPHCETDALGAAPLDCP